MRARKGEGIRVPFFSERVYGRASGVSEPYELGDLVEGLSGGVVDSLPEYPVGCKALHQKESSVAAGYDERDEREGRGVFLFVFLMEEGGKRMGLYVVDPGKGHSGGV